MYEKPARKGALPQLATPLFCFESAQQLKAAALRVAGYPSALGNAPDSDSSQARQFGRPRYGR